MSTIDLPALKALLTLAAQEECSDFEAPKKTCQSAWPTHPASWCYGCQQLALLAEVERLRLRLDELYSLAEEAKP